MIILFSEKDYENVLKATYQVSSINVRQKREQFKADILQVLSDHFQYHHMLFWEVTNGELNDIPICLNIEKYTVKDYLTQYKYYDPLHPMNMKNQPAIQLMSKNDSISCKEKNYYKSYFLQSNSYIDEMVMYLNNGEKDVAVIGFLRRSDEKIFNQQDVLKLVYLKRSIENIYFLHQHVQPLEVVHITEREEELLSYVCSGYKNHEIAQKMFVSENTVKKHLQNLYRKFQVTSKTQLAIIYFQKYKCQSFYKCETPTF